MIQMPVIPKTSNRSENLTALACAIGYRHLDDISDIVDSDGGEFICVARERIYDDFFVWTWQFLFIKDRLLNMMDMYDIYYRTYSSDSLMSNLKTDEQLIYDAIARGNGYQFNKI